MERPGVFIPPLFEGGVLSLVLLSFPAVAVLGGCAGPTSLLIYEFGEGGSPARGWRCGGGGHAAVFCPLGASPHRCSFWRRWWFLEVRFRLDGGGLYRRWGCAASAGAG
jgi:hypothetical protein